MNDTILIQQVYPKSGDPFFQFSQEYMDINVAANTPYCEKHKMDYMHVVQNLNPNQEQLFGSWSKVPLILGALDKGYKNVIWLDVDTVIWNVEVDLREACTPDHIGACYHRIPQLHHWNVGAVYYGNSERVKQFVTDWDALYPGKGNWAEQGVFNDLAIKSDVVQTISDKWNATIGYTEVPDAVVLAYHGAGNPEERLGLVKAALAARKEKHGW